MGLCGICAMLASPRARAMKTDASVRTDTGAPKAASGSARPAMTETDPTPAKTAVEPAVTHAFVLAAGLGKRMRPVTATVPKPLVEVAGRALLDHALDRVAEAGIGRAVVNVHWLADLIEGHLAKRGIAPSVTVSDERGALLETGGGVRKALPLLGEGAFVVLNSDSFWLEGPRRTSRG